jgi:ankyrin repeat protein
LQYSCICIHSQSFDVVDINGVTPLYLACASGQASIAKILTPVSNWKHVCHERRKDPNSPLYMTVTAQPALHVAVVNNHVDTVTVLLDCGVDVDILDVDGRTAINAAAKLGLYDITQLLILNGANVNSRSSKGERY